MNEHNPEFAHRFISARQGFHEYILSIREADDRIADKAQEITDINVSGIYKPAEFDHFEAIKWEYEELAAGLPADEPDRELLKQKIDADRMMARVLSGEEVGFDEFSLATIGLVPDFVYESTIFDMQTRLDQLLEERDLEYSSGDKKRFEEEFLLKDSDEIKRHFTLANALSDLALRKYVTVSGPVRALTFKTDEELPWAAYTSTDDAGRPFWIANTHPSLGLTLGKIRAFALHENGGHVKQILAWRNAISDGKMNPASGLTGQASPEIIHMEAVTAFAQTLQPEVAQAKDDKWIADFQIAYDELFMAVTHNAHIMINNEVPEDVVVEYAVDRMPFESPERLKAIIEAGRDLPSYRAAWGSYWPALELVRPVIKMDSIEQRREVVRQLYERSLTINQIGKVIADVQDRKSA